jgi:protease II
VRNVVFYDDNSIIYVTEDKNKRPSKIYYKKIGSSESRLIYE